MSAIDFEPPSTRFDSGHETNASPRSTITTSIAGSHMRMYLAAVAPPKPPPTTTTRAFPEVVAQPARNGTEASAAAPPPPPPRPRPRLVAGGAAPVGAVAHRAGGRQIAARVRVLRRRERRHR